MRKPGALHAQSLRDFRDESPGLDLEQILRSGSNSVPVASAKARRACSASTSSGRLRIDSVAVVGEDGGPPNDHGYVNHRYEAIVLDAVESGPPSRLTFSVMAEVGVATRKPGQEVFASPCKSTSTYYSPDNGYVFDATKLLYERCPTSSTQGSLGVACRPGESEVLGYLRVVRRHLHGSSALSHVLLLREASARPW